MNTQSLLHAADRISMAVGKAFAWLIVVLMLLVVVPWFWLVSERNPEFLRFFFIHEHWQRYTSNVHSRKGPLLYFVPLLLGASLRHRGEEFVAWPRSLADFLTGRMTALPLVHPWGNRLELVAT